MARKFLSPQTCHGGTIRGARFANRNRGGRDMGKHLSRMEYAWLLLGVCAILFVLATSPTVTPSLAGKDIVPNPRPRDRLKKKPPGVVVPLENVFAPTNFTAAPGERAKLGEKLRNEYPFISLQPRLTKLKRPSAQPNSSQIDLTAYSEDNRVDPMNSTDVGPLLTWQRSMRSTVAEKRSRAFELLHAQRVEDFIEAQGFGVSRNFELSHSPETYIVLREETAFSPESIPRAPKTIPGQPTAFAHWVSFPSATTLMNVLADHQDRFADPRSFGHVMNLDRVAGFRPHAFLVRPQLAFDDPPEPEESESTWRITRLELVSLLMHDEPAVYVSKSLPRMSELTERPVMRALDSFEQSSLAKLEGGENIVSQTSLNHIEMLGAIRAVNQCLQCHQVERGALLGAFRYTLHRDQLVEGTETITAR
jgi:hypothetical protein